MSLQRCECNGLPGWTWEGSQKCFTYTEGDPAGEQKAINRATQHGLALERQKDAERKRQDS